MGRKRGRHRRRKDRTLPVGTAVILASAVAGVYVTVAPGGASAAARTVYVSPRGSDGGAGTRAAPYRTLEKALAAAEPGVTIEVRGGTYQPARPLRGAVSGTADRRVRLRAYGSERVAVDGSRLPPGSALLSLSADYWTVSGLEFRAAPGRGVVCTSCTGAVFSDLDVHGNGGAGLTLRGRGSDRNLVRNLDSYDNHDDAEHGRDADGLAIACGSGRGNRVVGARLYGNSDDGVDIRSWDGAVAIERTWAYGNGRGPRPVPGGGDGFHLGDGTARTADTRQGRATPAAGAAASAHAVTDSAAWGNAGSGFAASGDPGTVLLRRTTAYANRRYGYDFPFARARLADNLAAANGSGKARVGGLAVSQRDNWNPGVPTPSFVTTDAAGVSGERRPGGALPATAFLVVADGSGIGSPMTARGPALELRGAISTP
ncbi:right-handed parallel beta-helix repeat-containing protein [Streptomyces sp. B1866]|uniref:right-handed parallel beta-helix repeat-containing protein n=1 Tax=Streptomyces sp. B1866 TaxID=3075431 RepID=UPI002891E545|nr:right-handed parallel beta-helix repeat-containing protein [Streptomyces sp. B1866]MDT3400264.1 right-handed parallel beta-helix repeat-containing protein [Streptomyces sp. B1866]